eukprot:1033869-Pelagomonas_calceolata.AAC.1
MSFCAHVPGLQHTRGSHSDPEEDDLDEWFSVRTPSGKHYITPSMLQVCAYLGDGTEHPLGGTTSHRPYCRSVHMGGTCSRLLL